jgi:peptidoglycan-associated lipoprotein
MKKRRNTMRKSYGRCLWVLCCGILLAAGCAKQELIRKDEGATRTVAAGPAAAARPLAKDDGIRKEPIKEASLKEAATEAGRTTPLAAALAKIYFDFDSYRLSDTATGALVKNAEFLKANPTAKVRIEGHCDERGSDEYNLALGEKRAKAASAYLTTLGVPADRLSTISYGREKPADPGHSGAAWAKNRRDEFAILTK